jgi:hypothetical protein
LELQAARKWNVDEMKQNARSCGEKFIVGMKPRPPRRLIAPLELISALSFARFPNEVQHAKARLRA